MIWFADLDHPDDKPYPECTPLANVITADDVMRIQGQVASPAELKKQLDELKVELEKKFHATEQARLFNRALIMLLLGIAVTIAISLIKPHVEGGKDQKQAPPAQQAPTQEPAPVKRSET